MTENNIIIEKEIWESTLNTSMRLAAENQELKDTLIEAREYIIEHIINHIGVDPRCRHLMFKLKEYLDLKEKTFGEFITEIGEFENE